MTHLFLIRHGAYVHTEGEHMLNPGLSPQGIEQAKRLRDRLTASHEIAADLFISSTMQRAQQTSEIIASAWGLPVEFDENLEEWRNEDGHVTAHQLMAALSAMPSDQKPFYRPCDTCETWAEFMFRACNALNRIVEEHAGKTIVVICHGGIIEASFLFFCGHSTLALPSFLLDPGFTSITHWRKVPGMTTDRWMLMGYNDTYHLHGLPQM